MLPDDNFATIAVAIEAGRGVFDNIRKFIVYIFAHAVPEVVPFLVYALSGGEIPLPLTVLQILAIDLGTETLPALALGREPTEPGLMKPAAAPAHRIGDPAADAAPGLGDHGYRLRCAGPGRLLRGAATGRLAARRRRRRRRPAARPVRGGHHRHLPGHRGLPGRHRDRLRCDRASLRAVGITSNPLLLWGIAAELGFVLAVVYLPPLQHVFGTGAVNPAHVAILLPCPLLVWGSDELYRWATRPRTPARPAGAAALAEPARTAATRQPRGR